MGKNRNKVEPVRFAQVIVEKRHRREAVDLFELWADKRKYETYQEVDASGRYLVYNIFYTRRHLKGLLCDLVKREIMTDLHQ